MTETHFKVEKVSEKTLEEIIQKTIERLTNLCEHENERFEDATFMPKVELQFSPSGTVTFIAKAVKM